jgi:hypothetical protein
MHTVLEFPAKVFVQWGSIAQDIASYLAQRGVHREEIVAVLDRLRARWEQLEPPPPGATGIAFLDADTATEASAKLEEGEVYASRHWRSQPARTLIESAVADYQRHTCR